MVKVRSLNSLLAELDFPKVIDFISIDTENTELDVLKGIDLNVYNVKMFVIENKDKERLENSNIDEQSKTNKNSILVII